MQCPRCQGPTGPHPLYPCVPYCPACKAGIFSESCVACGRGYWDVGGWNNHQCPDNLPQDTRHSDEQNRHRPRSLHQRLKEAEELMDMN